MCNNHALFNPTLSLGVNPQSSKFLQAAQGKVARTAPPKQMQPVKISPEDLVLPTEETMRDVVDDEVNVYQTEVTIVVVNKEELASRPRRMFPKNYNPFNVNLHELPYTEYMTAILIGERGKRN